MSDRLTKEWTTGEDALEEAFGETGVKGKQGEIFMCEVFESWDWEYIWHRDEPLLQNNGIDISFKSPAWINFYTCDVKNNLTESGTFYVYKDWLFKGSSDRIFHVNPETGWLNWYDRKRMQKYFDKKKEYITISTSNRPSWVKARKHEN
jgi:hypothetical protein